MDKSIISFLLAGAASVAIAADVTWSEVDGFWKTGGNWLGGAAPAANDTVIFPAGGYTVDIDKSTDGMGMVAAESGTSDRPLVFRDTAMRKLNIANGDTAAKVFTPGFSVGTGRHVVIDGIELSLGSYRDLEMSPGSILSADSGKVTLKYGNITVNTNAVLNVNGGTFKFDAEALYLKLAKNAVVNFNGGSNVIGRIVNEISENKGSVVSEFDGDGSKVVFAGGHNIFPNQYSLSSYVDYSKTEFSFTGGILEMYLRLYHYSRSLLPPKGGILYNRSEGLSMTDEESANTVWEIGGKAYFTGPDPYAIFGWGSGNSMKGGGELQYDYMKIGGNPYTADVSKIVLKNKFYIDSNGGDFRFADGITLGAYGDVNVYVNGNKNSRISAQGRLGFETIDAKDESTPRSFDLSPNFNFSQVTSLDVDGHGTVCLAPENSDYALGYLHKVDIDDGATVALTNGHAAVKTMTLSMGTNSLLLAGSNPLDVASSVAFGSGAKVRYSFGALEAGKMYPLWFGPHNTTPPAENFEFAPALPEGWTIALQGSTAYLSDGSTIESESDVKGYWLGKNGGYWNDSENWGINTNAQGDAANNIPGASTSLGSSFSGNRQLSVTNNYSGSICWLRNLLAKESAGPYVISGLPFALYYPTYEGGNSSSVANASAFPFVIESTLYKHRRTGPEHTLFRVQGNSDAPVVMAGGGLITNAVLAYRGDVRIGGEWRMHGLYPESSSSARSSRLTTLPGASVHVSDQATNHTVKSSYHISADSCLTVEGSVWRWTSNENTHFVDGAVTSACPVQATARQTFIGDGALAFWTVQSDPEGAGELKFMENATVRLGGWKTVRAYADNAMRMVVRDSATIGALGDWTYGPESGFESSTTAADRALKVTGGAKTRVTFDTEGHTVTFADPLHAEKWSTVVKQGEGSLVLASAGNKLDDCEFELLGGELKIDERQSFGKFTFGGGKIALGDDFAADSYELLFTAKEISGEVEVSGRMRVRTIAGEDGVSVFARRERGTAVVIR